MIFNKDVAAHYEAWYETPEGRRADELEKAVLGWLLQAFPRAGSVLEIGCGTAHFTRWLNDQGLAAVGLDFSAAMLAQARALDGVPLMQGNAVRLPFVDGAFDLAALVTTLAFLERPQEALAEALRVTRRGVVLGVLNRWSLLGLQRRLAGLFRPTVYDAARFYGVGELKRLATGGSTWSIAGERVRIVWRSTLFPRCWPWPQARLPWGGFIGMALIETAGAAVVAAGVGPLAKVGRALAQAVGRWLMQPSARAGSSAARTSSTAESRGAAGQGRRVRRPRRGG